MLSDSDNDDELQNEQLHKISINEHYAKAFQYRKEREELEQLKAKLGSDASESDLEEDEETDSESAESEDEDGEELTPTVDAAILRTLARIKQKDPSIYESGKSIFEEEQEKIAAKATTTGILGHNKNKDKNSAKPVTLRQVALEAQLNPSRSPSPEPLTHVQEQQALRKETISVFHTIAQEGEGDDDFLVPREKTKDEQEREEEEYRAFLEREVGDLKNIIGGDDLPLEVEGEQEESDNEENVQKKRKKKTNAKDHAGKTKKTKAKRKSKEEEDQEFLMNYILNRGWIDKSKDHIPTYKEVTSKSKSKSKKSKKSQLQNGSGSGTESDASSQNSANANDNGEDNSLSDASSFESLVDAFESSYNFRFEEPGSAHIPSFPRSIPSLVRREDTKRKEARERRKERKEEEKERKKEEVRRLKALKMREIRRKLELVGREAGLKLGKAKGKAKMDSEGVYGDDGEGGEVEGEVDAALKELDLEGDWDPEKHDMQMAGLFGGEEDGEADWEDGGDVDEDGRPVWKDDIDIGDIYMSNDEGDTVQPLSTKDKKKKKKKKKKNEEMEQEDEGVDIDAMDADVQALKRELGEEEEWDGTEEMRKQKLDEYMEEIYNLEFNDMVGDLPTRFKYATVAPQTYSLTPAEILLATDKELNEFMSIKKYAPYKNDARKWDTKRQQKLKELKAALVERAKNGGWLVKDATNSGGTSFTREGGSREAEGPRKAKKRKGKKERMKVKVAAREREVNDGEEGGESGDMHVNGSNLNKARLGTEKSKREGRVEEQGRKRKYGEIEVVNTTVQVPQQDPDESRKPKKKRRRKHKGGGEVGGA